MRVNTTPEAVFAVTEEKKQPPYRLYAALVGGILFARVFDLATQNMEWTIGVYNSVAWNRSLLTLAIVASSLGAFYLRRRLPPLIAWLSCGIIGGISMMLVNSISGAVIGLVIGAAVVATAPSVSIVTFFGRTIVPSMLMGFATGAFSAAIWFGFGAPVGGVREILSVALPLLVGGLITWKTLTFTLKKRRWYGWIGAATLFMGFSCVGLVWLVASRIDAIRNSFPTVNASSYGLEHAYATFFPFAPQAKRDTFRTIDKFLRQNQMPNPSHWLFALQFDQRSTAADIAKVSQLPFITSVCLREGCPITDEQFRKLNLRYATSLYCEADTKLTAEMLETVDFAQLQSLSLEGDQFGDDVLPYIQGTPAWFSLTLKDTRVTAEGLRAFADSASVVQIDLSGTQVDDRVFSALSGLTILQRLNLSRSNITGEGIEQLPRSIRAIDLSNTQFESKHLEKLATSKDPEVWDTFFLTELQIRNTRFDRKSTENLLDLALQRVNVSGLDLPMEFLQQLKTPVCGLEATTLTPGNIHLIKSAWLALHYDATKMSAGEIVKHFTAIKDAREKLFRTQPHDETLVVENLELTRESLRAFGFEKLNHAGQGDDVSFRFIDAKIRNRHISEIHGVEAVRSRFPELGGWDETPNE